MGSVYLSQMADWFRQAGLGVVEYDGWQHRARSSGGYENGRPWAILWHHTASKTSPESDASYMCHGSPDAPIANLLIARDGDVWVLAGGATNTNGKGKSVSFSKGTVPADSMNSYAVGVEIANNGVGEAYPQAQVDAAFLVNNTLADRLGLHPDDCCTHQFYAPDRKIDPATAAAVQGPWRPTSATSSGTWSQPDLEGECLGRAGNRPPDPGPGPGPEPPSGPLPEGDEMLVVATDANGTAWVGNGIHRIQIGNDDVFTRYIMIYRERLVNTSGGRINGWEDVGQADNATIAALGFA